MSNIDTVVARKYWKDETAYLDKIQFVAITKNTMKSVVQIVAVGQTLMI